MRIAMVRVFALVVMAKGAIMIPLLAMQVGGTVQVAEVLVNARVVTAVDTNNIDSKCKIAPF